ncbi:MAG: type II secretion system F family protein [Clostridia bacterium]|nr:type II secretion system F family protein [Clostridia bacterium]
MPLYRCKVINSSGQRQVVVKEASDALSLRAQMRQDKIHLLSFTAIKEEKQNEFFAVSSKIKFNEVVLFFRQFSVMLKAGIPLSECLNSLHKQKFSIPFRNVLQTVYLDVESGVLLSDAFAKHPKVFPRFFVNMVAIGEVSGSLDKVMTNMADYYENDRRIKKKASSAMVYPSLLIAMIFIVIIFLCLFVLPNFESTISQLGGEVPAITRVVMSISNFIQDYIFILLPGAVMIIFLIVLFFKTKAGKYVKDVLILKLPIISTVQRNLITARFSRAFIILLGSGMNMIDVLENLQKMLGNEVLKKKFDFTVEEVKRGRSISASIAATGLFPPILTQMIKVGENSGNIEEVLESTGTFFDEQVESSIAKAVAAIEPICILLLGGVVCLVVLSVLVPMMSMMSAV